LYEKDRNENRNGVELPFALERKYPKAGKRVGLVWGISHLSSYQIDPEETKPLG